MNLPDFASNAGPADVLFIKVGERVVRVPLTSIDEEGTSPEQLEGQGFENPEEMRHFVMLVCSRIVATMIPQEQREKLATTAASLLRDHAR